MSGRAVVACCGRAGVLPAARGGGAQFWRWRSLVLCSGRVAGWKHAAAAARRRGRIKRHFPRGWGHCMRRLPLEHNTRGKARTQRGETEQLHCKSKPQGKLGEKNSRRRHLETWPEAVEKKEASDSPRVRATLKQSSQHGAILALGSCRGGLEQLRRQTYANNCAPLRPRAQSQSKARAGQGTKPSGRS